MVTVPEGAYLESADLNADMGRVEADGITAAALQVSSGLGNVDLSDVTAGDVSLTQKDVRMIQLAKSAVCAGMYTLVERASLTTDDVSELLVAGGFGSYLDLGSAGKIGLIPLSIVPRTRVIGNASLDGASMLLLDKALRAESEAMANAAETVDLSTDPVFMEQYTEGMFF